MFILEGFNEISASNLQQSSLLHSLLSKTVLSHATLLVTTQPSAVAQLPANFIPSVNSILKYLSSLKSTFKLIWNPLTRVSDPSLPEKSLGQMQ